MDIKRSINIRYKMLLYDLLYFVASLLIKLCDPCKIHQTDWDISLLPADKRVTCINNVPCCTSCEYLDDNGCTVKCLGCKLALCLKAAEEHPKLKRSLIKMKEVAMKQDWCMVWIRTSREKVHQHLKRTR